MPIDPADVRRWRTRRWIYCGCLGLLFVLIAFRFGPNYFLFGKLTWITPADFVREVERDCVPTIRAMKRFQHDHGRLPTTSEEMIPRYAPSNSRAESQLAAGTFREWGTYNHSITYDFTPGHEGFYVQGAFVSGKIPLPPVTLDLPPGTTTRTSE